jgi:hypothetical protein
MAELTTILRQRGHVKSKLIGLKRLVDRISSSEAKEENIFELNQYLTEVENLIREFDDYHMKIILKCRRHHQQPDGLKGHRSILSSIAQIYDPLGLLSPCIIQAKIMLQIKKKSVCLRPHDRSENFYDARY